MFTGKTTPNSARNKRNRTGIILSLVLLFSSISGMPIKTDENPSQNITQFPTTWNLYLPIISNESCQHDTFGTMLTGNRPSSEKDPGDVMLFANDEIGVKGLVSAGAPSEYVRDEWFSKLPGWTRSFNRGIYEQLLTIHQSAITFNMADMYECIGYGPESVHEAGNEALEPLTWVPKAKSVAEASGKCLIYGPAVLDYEKLSMRTGDTQPDEEYLGNLISSVSPYVDIWMVQLAKYQRWADGGRDDSGNPFTMDDFENWIAWWVAQIKEGNPDAKVWAQLGIGVFDPLTNQCAEPQPPEYILDYRKSLLNAGVSGVFVVPSQPCQTSTEPMDQYYYQQTLDIYQEAISQVCNN